MYAAVMSETGTIQSARASLTGVPMASACGPYRAAAPTTEEVSWMADGLAGPLVAGRNDEDHAVLHEGLEVYVVALRGAFEQGELDVVGDEGAEHLIGVAASAVMRTCGFRWRKPAMKVGRRYWAMVCEAPRLSSPACWPKALATAATACSLRVLICSVKGRSAAPPGVRAMRPPPR